MIIHCMAKELWDERKDKACWGRRNLERDGFIHCSGIEYFWRVAPNFPPDKTWVLVCIDEEKLQAEVCYEDADQCGRFYPHIYGLVNREAVMGVLPLLRDAEGNYRKNPEFADIDER